MKDERNHRIGTNSLRFVQNDFSSSCFDGPDRIIQKFPIFTARETILNNLLSLIGLKREFVCRESVYQIIEESIQI